MHLPTLVLIAVAFAVGSARSAEVPKTRYEPIWSVNENEGKDGHGLWHGVPNSDVLDLSISCDASTGQAILAVYGLETTMKEHSSGRMVIEGPGGRIEFQATYDEAEYEMHEARKVPMERLLGTLSKPGNLVISVEGGSMTLLLGRTAATAVPRFRKLCLPR